MPFRVKVQPASAKETVFQYPKCLYAVSVGTHHNQFEIILEALEWTQNNFDHCSLLIGDSLYRITAQIQLGITAEEADEISLQKSEELLRRILESSEESINVIRCSEILKHQNFPSTLLRFQKYFSVDKDFGKSVGDEALSFIDRQENQGRLAVSHEHGKNLAIKYLLEEISIYSILADEGWLVDTYLGDELNVLKQIMYGQFPFIDGAIAKRINVSLTPRKKQR